MDFGKTEAFPDIDYTLPPAPAWTGKKSNQANKPFELHIGCAKWGRKEWVGQLYPKGTREEEFLENYARFFHSIELNATAYKIPTPEQVSRWAEKAGRGFTFCPKFSNPISNGKDFGESRNLTAVFAHAVKNFGEGLGPCFLVLADHYSTEKRQTLLDYIPVLKQFPSTVFVEFRHPSWFTGSAEAEEVFESLAENGLGMVITDTAGRRDVLHMRLTIPKAFVRFVANREHPTDFARIDSWAKQTALWKKNGLQAMYFFMHNDEDGEGHSPSLAAYAIGAFNKACGTQVDKVALLKEE